MRFSLHRSASSPYNFQILKTVENRDNFEITWKKLGNFHKNSNILECNSGIFDKWRIKNQNICDNRINYKNVSKNVDFINVFLILNV